MYPQQPPQPPRVDSSELRPGRVGYWAGGLVIVLGVIAGIALFVFFIIRAVAPPDLAVEVPDGARGTFSYTPDAETPNIALYSTSAAGSFDDCGLLTPSGEPLGFSAPGVTQEGPELVLVGVVLSPPEPGEYTLVCEGVSGATYSAAAVPDDFGLAGGIVGALISFFLIPLAGFVLGLILIITTAVRRNKHKKRLLAERGGYGHPYRG